MAKDYDVKKFDISNTIEINKLSIEMTPPRFKSKNEKLAYQEGFRDAINYMKRNK